MITSDGAVKVSGSSLVGKIPTLRSAGTRRHRWDDADILTTGDPVFSHSGTANDQQVWSERPCRTRELPNGLFKCTKPCSCASVSGAIDGRPGGNILAIRQMSTSVFGQRDHSSWPETQLGPAFFRLTGQRVGAWWPCKQGRSLGACWGRVVPFVGIVFNKFGMQHKCPDAYRVDRCLVLDVR